MLKYQGHSATELCRLWTSSTSGYESAYHYQSFLRFLLCWKRLQSDAQNATVPWQLPSFQVLGVLSVIHSKISLSCCRDIAQVQGVCNSPGTPTHSEVFSHFKEFHTIRVLVIGKKRHVRQQRQRWLNSCWSWLQVGGRMSHKDVVTHLCWRNRRGCEKLAAKYLSSDMLLWSTERV